ncbi:MAG TPA: helix-turn-helix domain-containing protein [Desulfatiglandales bacterium]|nr:helix-turn-helix domain-containing protein [Desulfatiglandales bacterium]
MKKSLRIDEVSEVLNCHRRTVYRLIEDGELEAFRVRTSLRVRTEELESYIKRQSDALKEALDLM